MKYKLLLPVVGLLLILAVLTYHVWLPYVVLLWSGELSDELVVDNTSSSTNAPTDSVVNTGPGTYRNDANGFSFNYSAWWSLEDNWQRGYLDLFHKESPDTGSDISGRGNSKIEIRIDEDISSFLDGTYGLQEPTEMMVAGQRAYFSTGNGVQVGPTYYIELPARPGSYLVFTMYGWGTKAQLDEVVQSLSWD